MGVETSFFVLLQNILAISNPAFAGMMFHGRNQPVGEDLRVLPPLLPLTRALDAAELTQGEV